MLLVQIPELEFYDERLNEFVTIKSKTLQLEHSLISLSKWESKWCKPFLGKEARTDEETIDYIRCMTVDQTVSLDVYKNLPRSVFTEITNYINAPMTATRFNESETKKGSREIITSELIYYWMISLNIPMECQKWHLNRLLTLVRVCNIKNSPPKKRSKKAMLAERKALNEARRVQYNTKG